MENKLYKHTHTHNTKPNFDLFLNGKFERIACFVTIFGSRTTQKHIIFSAFQSNIKQFPIPIATPFARNSNRITYQPVSNQNIWNIYFNGFYFGWMIFYTIFDPNGFD